MTFLDGNGAPRRNWALEDRGTRAEFFLNQDGTEMTLGDFLNIHVTFVDDHIKERFADAYNAWRAGIELERGLSLASWGQLPEAAVDELASYDIHTVDDLAALPDSKIDGVLERPISGKLLIEPSFFRESGIAD